MVKVPARPPRPLVRRPADLRRLGTTAALWRLHFTAGPHVTPWNRLRHFGPTAARFDPQRPPPHESSRGVTYAALDVPTAIAEVFQSTRVVDTSFRLPYLTGWHPARDLQLLDLTGTWPVRNGAAAALTSAPKRVCRTWAQAIDETWPDLDGLWTHSTMTGAPVVVLLTAAADAFPTRPQFSRPLTSPALLPALRRAARDIGYQLV